MKTVIDEFYLKKPYLK